jgi:hypothetical protein
MRGNKSWGHQQAKEATQPERGRSRAGIVLPTFSAGPTASFGNFMPLPSCGPGTRKQLTCLQSSEDRTAILLPWISWGSMKTRWGARREGRGYLPMVGDRSSAPNRYAPSTQLIHASPRPWPSKLAKRVKISNPYVEESFAFPNCLMPAFHQIPEGETFGNKRGL